MKIKLTLFLSSFIAIILAATAVMAGPHRGGGNFGPMMARAGGARPFAFNGMRTWNGQHWNGNHWNNNWNWHHHDHHDFNDVVFFGFPFWGWWDYPWYSSYYPYGYPYGYFGYGNGYYGNSGYGNGDGSSVSDLQRKLADAGYYHGSIDGVMGPRTRSALRAYRHDRSNGGNPNHGYSPTLRDRPYSPPPVTTEPSPGE